MNRKELVLKIIIALLLLSGLFDIVTTLTFADIFSYVEGSPISFISKLPLFLFVFKALIIAYVIYLLHKDYYKIKKKAPVRTYTLILVSLTLILGQTIAGIHNLKSQDEIETYRSQIEQDQQTLTEEQVQAKWNSYKIQVYKNLIGYILIYEVMLVLAIISFKSWHYIYGDKHG